MRDKRYLDMTEGNILKELLAFSIPLLIGMLFQQAYSLVDTMVAGYTKGDVAIASIGTTAALYELLISLSSGFNRGYAIVLTQAYGAHDKGRIKHAISSMIFLNLVTAVILTTLSAVFMRPLLRLLNTPEAIMADTYSYIIVIALGMSTTIFYNMFSAMLGAFGNSRTALYYLMMTSILNILLDLFFMCFLHTGIYGLALGTVLSAGVSALASGIYFFHSYKEVLPRKGEWRIDRTTCSTMLSYGTGMAAMFTTVHIGTLIFQGANNGLGTLFITAHTAARRLMVMLMQPQSVMSSVLSTFVSQNWGAGKKDRIKKGIASGCAAIFLFASLLNLIIFLFGGTILRLMTGSSDSEVLRYAVLSVRINVFLLPLCGILCCLRASLQAIGVRVKPVICSGLELTLKILAACFFIPRYGFIVTCVTEPVTWVVCFVFITISYLYERKRLLSD